MGEFLNSVFHVIIKKCLLANSSFTAEFIIHFYSELIKQGYNTPEKRHKYSQEMKMNEQTFAKNFSAATEKQLDDLLEDYLNRD